jgi:hypothetical protein
VSIVVGNRRTGDQEAVSEAVIDLSV